MRKLQGPVPALLPPGNHEPLDALSSWLALLPAVKLWELVGERFDHIAGTIRHVMRVNDNIRNLKPGYPPVRLFQTGTDGCITPHNDTNLTHIL
jgi:hypothetical protein